MTSQVRSQLPPVPALLVRSDELSGSLTNSRRAPTLVVFDVDVLPFPLHAQIGVPICPAHPSYH